MIVHYFNTERQSLQMKFMLFFIGFECEMHPNIVFSRAAPIVSVVSVVLELVPVQLSGALLSK